MTTLIKKHYTCQLLSGIHHITLSYNNSIGLIDAIKEVGDGNEILRAGEPGFPRRIIQVKKPLSYISNGTLMTVQPNGYVAAYKRGNDNTGDYLVAPIEESVVINHLKRHTALLQNTSMKERNHLFDLPTCPIMVNAFFGLTYAAQADVLYDKPEGKTSLKKIIRANKPAIVRTCGTDRNGTSYTQKIVPGQILALIQHKNGTHSLGFILPEDVKSIKAYYRHQERLIAKQTLLGRLISATTKQKNRN